MLDITSWIKSAGAVGGLAIIAAIIFSESGLLVGFFLPGDTLLFTAGFFAAQGYFPVAAVIAVVFVAAALGDNVGYEIGKRMGPRLFKKKDGILFRQEYVARAESFYEKHGGKTIVLARFVPVVRTFAPMVAGVGKMNHARFSLYNLIGAIGWSSIVILSGYWLGSLIDPHKMERYLMLAVAAAMVFTMGPTLLHLLREPRLRQSVRAKLEQIKLGILRRIGQK